jgi:hypothetical protein
MGFGSDREPEHDLQPVSNILVNEPVISLLGKDFIEIIQLLGETYEEGYSEAFGPHQYILYKFDEGFIRFSSPESLGKNIAVSIILGPGQEVSGAVVGMYFPEIVDILGAPAYGPEMGIDDLYYMDYFYGEINNQMPEIFISFVAFSIDSPTEYAFIKLENSKFEDISLETASTVE